MSRSLQIAVVTQFFTPEMGAPAARFHDFGRLLVERGHRVVVLTAFPNSPSGEIPEEYRRRFIQREEIDGITLMRSYIFASPRLTSLTKSAGFASFAVSASLQALLRKVAADVVIATAPPPTVGIPGLLLAQRLGAPLVFDVRDIWPEALAASGRLRSGPLIRSLEWLERLVYRRAAAITVVTEGKRERLLAKGVAPDRVHVLPNGVDLERFLDVAPMTEAERQKLGLDPGRFVVLYAGIMNPAQGLDVLVDAAEMLRRNSPQDAKRLLFLLVGGGSERIRLEQRVQNAGLGDAVRFTPIQPRDRIPSLLQAADAIVVPLRPRADSHTVPSKLYEAMASGRPVLVSADGAPREILLEAKAGLATPAADVAGLVGSILELLHDPERAQAFGSQGVLYARRFDRRLLVEKLEEILLELTNRKRS